MGEREVTEFLSHLATARRVSSSTQNQALAVLLFLYRDMLDSPIGWLDHLVRAKRPYRVPTVLSRDEARRVIEELSGAPRLVAMILYGSGLRLLEALCLRVKDVDLERRELAVLHGKGGRDRLTLPPDLLVEPLREQIRRVGILHRADRAAGRGFVAMPDAFGRKSPNAPLESEVAMAVSRDSLVPRHAVGPLGAVSLSRDRRAAGRIGRSREDGYRETRFVPHIAPLVRDAPARVTRGRIVDGRLFKSPWRDDLRH